MSKNEMQHTMQHTVPETWRNVRRIVLTRQSGHTRNRTRICWKGSRGPVLPLIPQILAAMEVDSQSRFRLTHCKDEGDTLWIFQKELEDGSVPPIKLEGMQIHCGETEH